MSQRHIQEAKAEDTEVVARLIRESFRDVALRFSLTPENCPKHPSNCTTAWVEADQAKGVQYFIAFQANRPSGCVGLELADSTLAYIERLAVLPDLRRQGLGRALVDHVLSRAKSLAVDRVSVAIIADQTELKQWYLNQGFEEAGTKDFAHLPFRVTFLGLGINDGANTD